MDGADAGGERMSARSSGADACSLRESVSADFPHAFVRVATAVSLDIAISHRARNAAAMLPFHVNGITSRHSSHHGPRAPRAPFTIPHQSTSQEVEK
jgi:hypothetical protein